MGWLFKAGYSRSKLIAERIESWDHERPDGVTVHSKCLAHCFRGNVFSGVLWTVWERTFERAGIEAEKPQRWIGCELLRCEREFGWGYKDIEESMYPYFYSCPLSYLKLVPLEVYGGRSEWREWFSSTTPSHRRNAERGELLAWRHDDTC